eukprot:2777232-Alexandrium_andersonii.AAC.1
MLGWSATPFAAVAVAAAFATRAAPLFRGLSVGRDALRWSGPSAADLVAIAIDGVECAAPCG